MKVNLWVAKIAVAGILLLIACAGINRYMHVKTAGSFREPQSFIEEGKGELRLSKDGLFKYRVDKTDDSAMIMNYEGEYLDTDKKIKDLVIPEELDGHPVSCIEQASFAMDEVMETLTLPSCLKELRRDVIFCIPNLKKVYYMGDSLTKIEDGAFDGYEGDVVTAKNSPLWKFCRKNQVNVMEP